jgi:putative nucleotidyltransferase with HDIG domain
MDESYRAMLKGWDRLGRATSVSGVLVRLATLMKTVLDCRLALCYLLPGGRGAFLPVSCCGLAPSSVSLFLQHFLPLEALSLFEQPALRTPRRLLLGELAPGLFPPPIQGLFARCALLAFPMQVKGKILGIVFVLRDRAFDDKETALIGWTVSHAALVVRSFAAGGTAAGRGFTIGTAALQETGPSPGQESLVGTVSRLVDAMEAKSPWTRRHSERVMRSCAIIAAAMGLGEKEMERVRLGGLFHDIGKMEVKGVDNPGMLDADEDPHMTLHPEMGVAMLSSIRELKGVLPGILYHHERFDGQGYPAGLKGKAIPRDARIIAVADAFDAMVSERPYKSGSGRGDALAELEHCAGSQFDPQMVRCLINFIKERGRR